jgi:SanA protein
MNDRTHVATRPSLFARDKQPGEAPQHRHRRRLWMLASLLLVVAALAAFPFLWQQWVQMRYASSIYALDAAPDQRVAIVLGARVYPSGRLSGMLRDRVETAVALYQAGKVDKIIMTGDNSQIDYNEPDAMRAHAVALGVPAEDIQPDYGGRRTYDSCYRARAIFGVEEAVIVTQAFHLPRAIFLCEQIGIDAVGVEADRQRYDPRSIAWSEAREVPATLFALVDAIRRIPPPVLGDPIPLD